jgi:hypothetical protein
MNNYDSKTKNLIPGQPALTSMPDATDELLISDAGVTKRVDYSVLMNRVSFRAMASANQVINSGATVTIQFNTKTGTGGWDSHTFFDTGTYTFTPTIAGIYLIGFYGILDQPTSCRFQIVRSGDGVTMARIEHNISGGITSNSLLGTLTTPVYLNGSQGLSCSIVNGSAAAKNWLGDTTTGLNAFWGVLIASSTSA